MDLCYFLSFIYYKDLELPTSARPNPVAMWGVCLLCMVVMKKVVRCQGQCY
jgi:hypothetical protein